MFDVKPIVQRLKSYGKEHNMTQGELAKRIGASGPALSRWLNEHASFNPKLNQLINMADLFGVSLSELLSQENTPVLASPEKSEKDTGKKAKNKPAAKKSTKAASEKNSKGKSEDVSREKAKQAKSKRTVKTSATAIKETKSKKTEAHEKAVKTERNGTAKKTAKAAKSDTGETPAEKQSRTRKQPKA